MVRGVTALLFQTNKLKVQASLALTEYTSSSENWYYQFRGGRGEYLIWYPSASLKLKYIKDKETEYYTDEYSRTDQIHLTYKNIGAFKMDLRDFYLKFQRPDLYQYDENGIPVSLNKKKSDSVIVVLDDNNYLCAFEPIIMPDTNGQYRPGVSMKINVKAQEVRFTVTEFESFYDLIQGIRLYELGFDMLQTYLGMMRMETPSGSKITGSRMPNLYKSMEVNTYETNSGQKITPSQ